MVREGGLWYDIMGWLFLLYIGTYHMYSAIRNQQQQLVVNNNKSSSYAAKPYYPLNLNLSSSSYSKVGRHIQLYLTIVCLTVALIHHLILSSEPDPLLTVHLFSSLHSSAVILLFLLLSLSLLPNLPNLPTDLFFALSSAAFYLHSSSSSSFLTHPGLLSECYSLSSKVSSLSSLLCLLLAFFPTLFVADLALGASLCLQAMWTLQTGLSLHVDSFIPLGCHKLLDVVNGVEGSTKCDLDDSTLRAVALLNLLFVLHALIVVVLVMLVYAVAASKPNNTTTTTLGTTNNNNNNNNNRRRFGSYEALPTTVAASSSAGVAAANVGAADSTHIQMKALAGTQA